MAFTKSKLDKLIQKNVTKFVTPLEGARSTYTPASKSALVRQRIEERLADLTPDIAPTMRFVPTSGYIGQGIAYASRWRKFRVEVASFTAAETGRGSSQSHFDVAVTVEVGYPAEPMTTVAGVAFEVADVKSCDDEQLDGLMRGGDLLSNPTVVPGAQVVSLESAFDLGNTVRRHRYVLRVSRTFP